METRTATQTPIALIRVAALAPVAASLRRAGAPVMGVLRDMHLPDRLLDRPEALISTGQGARFIEAFVHAGRLDFLRLLARQETPMEALGVFGRLVRHARTVQEAIDSAIATLPAFDSGSRLRLERDGGCVRLTHECVDAPAAGHRLLRAYWSIFATSVVGAAAAASDDVRMGKTAVTFRDSLLGRPLPPSPTRRYDDDLEAWRASGPAADFTGAVRQVITTLGSDGHPRIHDVAVAIDMSVRVLQRRLADVGVTFEMLVAEERLGAAVELLEETDASVLDIALDLGYSDHAHFTRAFRRWTGVPPREFRRMSRAQPAA